MPLGPGFTLNHEIRFSRAVGTMRMAVPHPFDEVTSLSSEPLHIRSKDLRLVEGSTQSTRYLTAEIGETQRLLYLVER
jgi:hypothetical protein